MRRGLKLKVYWWEGQDITAISAQEEESDELELQAKQ
jgi:hypothetical protein